MAAPELKIEAREPAYDLAALRAQFPIAEEVSYLNHAGISPLATRVKVAQQECLEGLASGDRVFASGELMELYHDLVALLCRLINAEADEIAIVQNTAVGISIVAEGLDFQAGDNIIICDKEYPVNVYPWMHVAQRCGAELRVVPPEHGGLTLNRLQEYADDRTALVSVSSVEFLTGHRTDVQALGDFCHEHDILYLVDGIQSLGHVPIDVQASHVDFLASGGMKSLLGPPGIGFLYISRQKLEQVTPTIVGAGSVTDFMQFCDYNLEFRPEAARFEVGTPNIVGMAGLKAGLELLLELGVANIDAWTTYLADVLMDDLARRGYEIMTPRDPKLHANIVTWESDDVEAEHQRLTEQGVIAANREGNLRASPHCYNTVEDVLRVGEVLGDRL